MRKGIYKLFQNYNDLVLKADRKGNPYIMERQLDTMEIAMDSFLKGGIK